jgi:Smr domain-containing protein
MILFRCHRIILCEEVQEYYQKPTFIIFQPACCADAKLHRWRKRLALARAVRGTRAACRLLKSMARLKLDLHNVYNNSKAIDQALNEIFEEAIEKRIREVEIIPGKGSGQLRKKVERFLQQPHIKPLYHRIENDSKNFGRLFIYFKF